VDIEHVRVGSSEYADGVMGMVCFLPYCNVNNLVCEILKHVPRDLHLREVLQDMMVCQWRTMTCFAVVDHGHVDNEMGQTDQRSFCMVSSRPLFPTLVNTVSVIAAFVGTWSC